MNAETMLSMLKVDLGITTTAYDARLSQMLTVAENEIKREGAKISPETSVDDANLVILYTAWMWRKRDAMEAMPRMIRWQLNNRVFGKKG